VPSSPTRTFGATTGQTIRLPHDPRASRTARAELTADLRARAVPQDVVDDAEIVLAELFGNAVRHALPVDGTSVIVSWRVRGELVEVDVTDGGGQGPVRQRQLEALAVGGHGLNIVAAMSRSWGVVETGSLHTVWASIVHEPPVARSA
jgi:serine/threonine-protein kinase RsbW